jgi:hypothetical protein
MNRGQFRSDAKHDLPRPAPEEVLGHTRSVHGVSQGSLGALVPKFGREPDIEVQLEGQPRCVLKPRDVQAADPHGVAMKIVLDDGELTSNDLGLEYGTPVLSQHPPDVVGDSLDSHQPESSTGG